MSETGNSDKTVTAAPPKATLHLKRPVEQGTVRQSFSHGRSKAVVVEKVKRRMLTPAEAAAAARAAPPGAGPPPAAAHTASARPAPVAPAKPTAPPPPKTGVAPPTLSAEQREARARALIDARASEEDDRRRQEADAGARREREARDRLEREAAEARKRDEELRRAHEASFKRQSEDEARRRLSGGEPAQSPSIPRVAPAAPIVAVPGALARTPAAAPGGAEEERRVVVRRPALALPPGQKVVVPTPRPTRTGAERNRGRLTVTSATSGEEERTRSVAAFRRRTQRLRGHGAQEQKEKIAREIVLPEAITIQELASRMSERAVDVIKLLMRQGRMVTLTDVLEADDAQLIAEEMGHSVKRVAESDVEEGLFDRPDEEGASVPRPPIVTIMGHVDHGKTSLLDAIRHANVVAGEAGGITQHIGAYQAHAPGGQTITFIDTPGHAAFTAMRARGAKVTDIVVLVVAADDGVMPQTIEAIHHAKAAKVPIIVAINKIDKPEADPARVTQELLQYDVQVEAFGGDTLSVEVSATKRLNIDKLLEMLGLQAEIPDPRANPTRPAHGTVNEAKPDRGRGPVATVLIQRGTLRVGHLVVAGAEWGRVRALMSDTGHSVVAAGPSMPVEVLGFNGTPEASDRLAVVDTESRAREITDYRARQKREKMAAKQTGMRGSLEQMMSQLKTSGRKEFPLVIKGDVQGSIEAITGALEKLGTSEVAARILFAGAGGITESDVTLAEASGAAVIGFNVRAHKEAREAAEQAGVEIRYYDIIYNLVDDVKKGR